MRYGLVLAAVALVAAAATAAAVTRTTHHVAVGFRSVAIGGLVRVTVVLPGGYETSGERYPVVYFLHGLPAPPTAYRSVGWLEQALQRVDRPAILVVPQAARRDDSDPEYLDWGAGRNWGTYVTSEVPAYVDAHFRTIRSRAGRALVGLSAGGYGAAQLGFRHPDRFSVIESWSGYFHATDPSGRNAIAAPPRANVHALIDSFASYQRRHPTFLAFYVGAGDDRFRAENEQLDRELRAARVPHVFRVVTGGHEPNVWQKHVSTWLGLALARLARPHG